MYNPTTTGSEEPKNSCPNCGYCPHCGRANVYPSFQPYWGPNTAPWYPSYPPTWIIYGSGTVSGSGTITNVVSSNTTDSTSSGFILS